LAEGTELAMPVQLQRGLLEKRRQPRRKHRDKRPIFEELVAIDARAMARKGLIPKDYSTWVFDFVVPHARLTVTASEVAISSRDGREQSLAIHWQRIGGVMRHNAARPVFICKCQRRAFRLYDLHGRFCCKHCAIASGASYASRQISRKGRPWLQGQRLRRLLGEHPGISTIHKPPFLHRKSYQALLAKLRQVEAKTDGRKYQSKRLTERMLKPSHMYQLELASIAHA
jgi:hypothetical protein